MLPPGITDNAALHRFELHADGATAFLLYDRHNDLLRLIHTEVPDSLQGKGIGSKLVTAVLQFAQENQLRIVPLCPFVAQYLQRHPEYAAIVEPQYRWMIESSKS